jgi:peptidoglycan glycosyltransferase
VTAALRRNTEAFLLGLSVLIAVGGFWLSALPSGPQIPPAVFGYALLFGGLFLAAHVAVRRFAPAGDALFLPIAALLNVLGFILVARLDRANGGQLAAAQARWTVVAVAAFILTLWFVRDVRSLARYRYSWAVAGVGLLFLPILPLIGREVNGARLWVRLGPLNFQPAELAKIILVLFFAGYLAEQRELLAVGLRRLGMLRIPEPRALAPVAVAWAVSLLIMILEKDLGSSLLFFTIFIVVIWVATGRTFYLVAGGVMFLLGAFLSYQLFGHVADRIVVWLDPFAHIEDRGYQLVQSLFALATGGVWGTGLGLGRPDLIPNAQTDFIFSALGEELGLAGTAAVLTAYALFTSRGLGLATRCRDDFSKLLVTGLVVTFSIQSLIIIAGVTRLIPLTGITLPFMSYGGSSLLSNFILVALLVRTSDEVARQEGEGPPTELTLAAGGGR